MAKKRALCAVLATALITSALCLALYRFDNKYTAPGAQPISGLLELSEAELRATPVRYLIREWQFYPGVLLSPQEVDAWTGYRTHLDIGGSPAMSHGSGTYRLTLLLPERMQTYALELPEVFSACRLYVNGAPLLTLGEPDPAHYKEAIAACVVSFQAAGKAELLLAVSDRSGVYSGLTYPPAFGLEQAVQRAREARLLLHGAGVLLAFCGAVLAVSFGWKGSRRRGVLFLLCSLCFGIAVGYPLLHGLFAVAYRPWYALESAGAYGLLLLGVLLSCELCGLSAKAAALFSAPCAFGLLCAVLRTAGAAEWGNAVGQIFSVLSLILKVYSCLCLLGLSIRALRQNRKCSQLLLCGVLALSVCLAFDRLLPLYEPIFGGWFGELGGAMLTLLLAAALLADAADAYRFRLAYAGELRQFERNLALQKEHYRQLSEQVVRAREASHDLRHHMRMLRDMAEQCNTDRIITYLDDYEPHLREREIMVYSDHPIADAVLCRYAAAAKALQAECDIRLAVPPDLTLPDDELCILLANLLENAVEALSRQQNGPRRLFLHGDVSDCRLRLAVENSFDGVLHRQGKQHLSVKHAGFGMGLHSVQTIAEKYGGLADFSAEGTVFRASVLLPLPAAMPYTG